METQSVANDNHHKSIIKSDIFPTRHLHKGIVLELADHDDEKALQLHLKNQILWKLGETTII